MTTIITATIEKRNFTLGESFYAVSFVYGRRPFGKISIRPTFWGRKKERSAALTQRSFSPLVGTFLLTCERKSPYFDRYIIVCQCHDTKQREILCRLLLKNKSPVIRYNADGKLLKTAVFILWCINNISYNVLTYSTRKRLQIFSNHCLNYKTRNSAIRLFHRALMKIKYIICQV